jgi:hypothetical protein
MIGEAAEAIGDISRDFQLASELQWLLLSRGVAPMSA